MTLASVDPPSSALGWQIVLQIALIFLNAVFACAEIAVLSVSETKVERLASEGNKKASKLARLISQPARFLATIQVAITLSGFLGSAFAADNFAVYLTGWLYDGLGWHTFSRDTVNTLSVIIITVALSFVTLVLGELVPKRIAQKKSEKLALGMSGMIRSISIVFAPVVWLLTVSTNGVLRLLGIDPREEAEEVSEEEIMMMVDAGGEKGTIGKDEQELIENVFEFDDTSADDIATHRTDIALLWMEESMEEWEKTISETEYTLYPICDESVDNVVGILNTKSYFRLKDKSRENVMENAVKQPYFVPETVKADLLFRNMKHTKNAMAVVLDEYGGMSGIVTMTDLVEQLVGDLEDGGEDDVAEPMLEKIDDETWELNGYVPLEEVAEETGLLDLPADEYDSFGGYVFGMLGSIPDDGTSLELDSGGLHIRVVEINDHRIEKALITCVEKSSDEDGDKNGDKDED